MFTPASPFPPSSPSSSSSPSPQPQIPALPAAGGGGTGVARRTTRAPWAALAEGGAVEEDPLPAWPRHLHTLATRLKYLDPLYTTSTGELAPGVQGLGKRRQSLGRDEGCIASTNSDEVMKLKHGTGWRGLHWMWVARWGANNTGQTWGEAKEEYEDMKQEIFSSSPLPPHPPPCRTQFWGGRRKKRWEVCSVGRWRRWVRTGR